MEREKIVQESQGKFIKFLPVLTLVLFPTYTIRFNLLGLPLNLLLVYSGLVIVLLGIWIIRNQLWLEFIKNCKLHRNFLIIIGAFFISGILSLFSNTFSQNKAGEFVVLFLEPLALYFGFKYIFQKVPPAKELFTRGLYVCVAIAGWYALFQYVTLIGLPTAFQGNDIEPKRALSFFEYPNAYALFIAPALAYLLPGVLEMIKALSKDNWKNYVYPLFAWSFGVIGFILSLSRGGWLGLAAASLLAVILIGNKRLKYLTVLVVVAASIIVCVTPNLRYRIVLPFLGEKSAVSRVSLWDTAKKMIQDDPILGKGLLGYSQNFAEYNTDPGLLHHKYPHNIWLTLWVDTGILGLLSFSIILIWLAVNGLRKRTVRYKLGILFFVVALAFHGLVDVPYFKNDLAVFFWLVLSVGN